MLTLIYFIAGGLVEGFSDDNGVSLADKTTYAHNQARYLHAVQDLVWDQDLADESLNFARQLSQENSLHHSEGSRAGEYGENLYKGFNGFKNEKTIADAVFNWYGTRGFHPSNIQC